MSLFVSAMGTDYNCDSMGVLEITDVAKREVLCDEGGSSSDRHQPTLSSVSHSILLAWLMIWKRFDLLLM